MREADEANGEPSGGTEATAGKHQHPVPDEEQPDDGMAPLVNNTGDDEAEAATG
jgi:hypothetical protein